MEVQEFGKQNSRKIMLLPGNMMSWRQFEAVIPLLEKLYPVSRMTLLPLTRKQRWPSGTVPTSRT